MDKSVEVEQIGSPRFLTSLFTRAMLHDPDGPYETLPFGLFVLASDVLISWPSALSTLTGLNYA